MNMNPCRTGAGHEFGLNGEKYRFIVVTCFQFHSFVTLIKIRSWIILLAAYDEHKGY